LDLFDETTRLGRGILYAVNKYPHGNDKPSQLVTIEEKQAKAPFWSPLVKKII
jgi:hypothetical protein